MGWRRNWTTTTRRKSTPSSFVFFLLLLLKRSDFSSGTSKNALLFDRSRLRREREREREREEEYLEARALMCVVLCQSSSFQSERKRRFFGLFFFSIFLFFALFLLWGFALLFLLSSLSDCNCFCQNIINHERTFNKDKDEEERSFEKSDFGERRRKANRFFCERTNRNGDDGSARKERLGEDVLTVGDSQITRVQGKSKLAGIHGRDSRRRGETDEGK